MRKALISCHPTWPPLRQLQKRNVSWVTYKQKVRQNDASVESKLLFKFTEFYRIAHLEVIVNVQVIRG